MKSIKANVVSPVPTKTLPPAPANPAVTPWFPPEVTPARIGVYERKYGTFWGEVGFSLWDGKNWRFKERTVENAAAATELTINAHREWRGLASNPAKGQQ